MEITEQLSIPDQSIEVSDDSLRSALGSAIRDVNSKLHETEQSVSTKEVERGTPTIETKSNEPKEQGEESDLDPQTDPKQTIASNSEAVESNKSRIPGRIEELLNKNKELTERLAKLETVPVKTQNDQTVSETQRGIPEVLKRPQSPSQYTKLDLLSMLQEARAKGLGDLELALVNELEKVRDFENDMVKWEISNGRAYEVQQHNINYWKTQADTKYVDRLKPETELGKAFVAVEKFVNESTKNPEKFEYNKAYMADIFRRATLFDAMEKKTKDLEEKIASLQKKAQPLKQKESADISPSDPANTMENLKGNALSAIRSINSRRAA